MSDVEKPSVEVTSPEEGVLRVLINQPQRSQPQTLLFLTVDEAANLEDALREAIEEAEAIVGRDEPPSRPGPS